MHESTRSSTHVCVAHYEKVVGIKMRSGGGTPGHSGMPRCVPTQPENAGGHPKTYTIAAGAARELRRCVGKSTSATFARHLKSGSDNRARQATHSNNSSASAQIEHELLSSEVKPNLLEVLKTRWREFAFGGSGE